MFRRWPLQGESAQLILPPRYSLLAGLRGWPSWLQEGMRSTHAGTLDRSRIQVLGH